MKRPKYPSDLTDTQKEFIKANLPELFARKLKYDYFELINSILYLLKTGCQWAMLPSHFPKWRCVYNHFRSWSDRGLIDHLLKLMVKERRKQQGLGESPHLGVIDSQSVKWGTIDSSKGVDGFKKVKGIKRHICVDSQGNPLEVYVTRANIHDSKGAYALMDSVSCNYMNINRIKADKGYRGNFVKDMRSLLAIEVDCVKSNFGTSDFIPMEGRWVVERTFSWIDNYRRMKRNYEKKLSVARQMAVFACVAILMKHII